MTDPKQVQQQISIELGEKEAEGIYSNIICIRCVDNIIVCLGIWCSIIIYNRGTMGRCNTDHNCH